jgi:hypothetical protein
MEGQRYRMNHNNVELDRALPKILNKMTANKSSNNVEMLKYLGTTVKIQITFIKKIRSD